jgi:hypothetical protein
VGNKSETYSRDIRTWVEVASEAIGGKKNLETRCTKAWSDVGEKKSLEVDGMHWD